MTGDPVLLLGIPSEPPLALTAQALAQLAVPHLVLNQRSFAETDAVLGIAQGVVTGVLFVDGIELALEGFGGLFTRMMDFDELPELEGVAADDPRVMHASRLHRVLHEWSEVMPGRVVNPARSQRSNASKPYQAQRIAPFFAVPETLVTNDPAALLAFRDEHERIIYKSISGTRSIVTEFADEDDARLPSLATCPVQFQRHVDGMDIRVHTLANGRVFATEVHSDATDYRYATGSGRGASELTSGDVPDDVGQRCLALAAALGLGFAGIDLRRTPDGEYVCFEVNPSPAFSFYEEATGQPIADALARYLAGLE